MEMVQFHPTGLLAGAGTRMTGTVLEEGLRGAGGVLLNGAGERFMAAYDEAGERATRDIVSRAITDQMRKGRTTPNGGVYIEMKHLGPAEVARRFAGMVRRCADCGFDLAAGRVEVVPTAHYLMGGVVCDPDTRTALRGLFVAGEDAGGVHGANRLGGNGVANSTVYGGIAGEVMAAFAAGAPLAEVDRALVDHEIARARAPFAKPQGSAGGEVNALRERLLEVMWDHVGVLRDRAGLEAGLAALAEIAGELGETGLSDPNPVFNLTWHDWLNLRSLVEVGEVVARAALARENSRGAHYREDFPDQGDLASSDFTVARRAGGAIEVTRAPVAFTIVRPGQSLLDEPAPAA
jgi:fumarate reductase flavoprotein subunit